MRSAVLTNPEEVVESSWGAAPPSNIEEDEFDVLAFELWQLGSCPEMAAEDTWLDAEENVLVPR
jgi:hypothetical protein